MPKQCKSSSRSEVIDDDDQTAFNLRVLRVLRDPEIMDKIKLELFPTELKDLQVTLKSLQEKLTAKDADIESLEEQIAHLDCELNKCEQYSR